MYHVSQHSQPQSGKPHFEVSDVTPFEYAEEAWFWFIAAQEAKNDGAKFVAGAGMCQRPCEPIDILKVLDRLHRNRRLHRDHLLVLRHYGRRNMAPDKFRPKEKRAYHVWYEALDRIEDVLIAKGIVRRKRAFEIPAHCINQSSLFEGVAG